MRIDDFASPSGGRVVCVSAPVATVDRHLGLRAFLPTPNAASAFDFVVPSGGDLGSAEAPAAAATVAQRTSRVLQGEHSAVITDPAAFASLPPGNPASLTMLKPSGRISTWMRRRTATAAGTAPPAADYGFGPGGAPRPSVRRPITPPRAPRPRPHAPVVMAPAPAASSVPTVPISSDHDRAEPVGPPLLRLPLPTDAPPVITTDVNDLGAATEFQLDDPAGRYSHAS